MRGVVRLRGTSSEVYATSTKCEMMFTSRSDSCAKNTAKYTMLRRQHLAIFSKIFKTNCVIIFSYYFQGRLGTNALG